MDEMISSDDKFVPIWKSVISEFIGTFILFFIATGVGSLKSSIPTAFAAGLTLSTLINIFGNYSGAHFNPVVTMAFALVKKLDWKIAVFYCITQFISSIIASALILFIMGGESGIGETIGSLTYSEPGKALLVEIIITFILVTVILLQSLNDETMVGNSIAIAPVLTFNILFAGSLTGASMNPARSFGPALLVNNMAPYWIYLIGPLIGSLLAIILYIIYTYNSFRACGTNCRSNTAKIRDYCCLSVQKA